MADRPNSPFSGLDKALLRSTKPAGPSQQPKEDGQRAITPSPLSSVPTRQALDVPSRAQNTPTTSPTVQSNDRTVERSNGRTVSPHRKTVRHSFQFYEDQIDTLKRASLEAQLRGQGGP